MQESFVVRIYRLNILYRIFCGLKRVLLIKYADHQTERLIVVVMPTFPSLLFSYKSSTLFTSTYWRQASRPIFFYLVLRFLFLGHKPTETNFTSSHVVMGLAVIIGGSQPFCWWFFFEVVHAYFHYKANWKPIKQLLWSSNLELKKNALSRK